MLLAFWKSGKCLQDAVLEKSLFATVHFIGNE